MKKIEEEVQAREAAFIKELQTILASDCTDRIKIAKFYQSYVSCASKVNTIVSEGKV